MTEFSLEFVFASGEKHSPKAEPNEWLLRSDADTVADSLTVRFSVGKRLFTEEPVGAVLKKDGAVLFDGIVDEHRVKCRNGARTEVFFLRSLAAAFGADVSDAAGAARRGRRQAAGGGRFDRRKGRELF